MERQLLILDLDETLIYSSDTQPIPNADFTVLQYSVLKRPFVDRFLEQVSQWFDLAVWTASSKGYAQPIIERLFPDPALLKFAWFYDRCTQQYDHEAQAYYRSKNLKKVKQQGYPLEQTLIIDDSPEKLRRHYGNHIRVAPFTGDLSDTELRTLLPFLNQLRSVANVRAVEKRGWRYLQFPPTLTP